MKTISLAPKKSIAVREQEDRVTDRSIYAPPIKPGFEQFHSTEIFKNSLSRLHKQMASDHHGSCDELKVTQERFKEVMEATEYLPSGTMQELVKGLGYLEEMKGADSVVFDGTTADRILNSMKSDLDNVIEAKLETSREESPSRSMKF
jgi:hypothetical protein